MTDIQKWLMEALIFAAVLAAIAFGVHRFLDYEQGVGYARAVAEYTAKALVAEKAAREKEQALQLQLQEAQNAAIERDRKLQELMAASAAATVSMRDTVSTIRRGLPLATADAARKAADAFAAVFTDCQGRYTAVAKAADGHASDVQTLKEAWPK